jgi:hypothetical protein
VPESRELRLHECEALLRAGVVGRVGLVTSTGPHILPVNYSVVDGAIIIRTSPYSVLGTYGRDTTLAFEVDYFDHAYERGCSVLARGRSSVVSDAAELGSSSKYTRIIGSLMWSFLPRPGSLRGRVGTRTLLSRRGPGERRRSTRPRGRSARTLMGMSRIFTTSFASVYPLYVTKAEKKGRTKAELDQVIEWLTGFDQSALSGHLAAGTTFEDFFADARLNPQASSITGVVCGVRVEDVDDPLMQKIRYLDKLVDELAKGKSMDKILRS